MKNLPTILLLIIGLAILVILVFAVELESKEKYNKGYRDGVRAVRKAYDLE